MKTWEKSTIYSLNNQSYSHSSFSAIFGFLNNWCSFTFSNQAVKMRAASTKWTQVDIENGGNVIVTAVTKRQNVINALTDWFGIKRSEKCAFTQRFSAGPPRLTSNRASNPWFHWNTFQVAFIAQEWRIYFKFFTKR